MIYLLDSDIIIYATRPDSDLWAKFLESKLFAVSIVSFVEVLGFHAISDRDKRELENFFASTQIFPITTEVANKAVELRQRRKINLGDSLIAATAIINKCSLVTNNVTDFKWIKSLTLANPF